MGQRLVVDIKRHKKRLATVYFHWSAYTRPGIFILNLMNQHVFENSNDISDEELVLRIIRFAEKNTGLGFCETDDKRTAMRFEIEKRIQDAPVLRSYFETLILPGGVHPGSLDMARDMFPNETFQENISRNSGLVSLTDEGMDEALAWSEGTVEVDLDIKHVVNGLVDEYTIGGYLNEMYDYEEFVDPELLPRSPIALDEFDLDEIVIVNDVLAIEEEANWIRYEDRIYRTIR